MNKYNEAMAYVNVSEEMKSRILGNIRAADLTHPTAVRFANIKRYIALAACFAVVIAGALAVTLTNRQPQPGGVQTGAAAVEYKSAKALSKASGIKIEDLRDLPFEATETLYLDYQNDLVEIVYADGAQTLYYRVSEGNEDNSGDYTEYAQVSVQEIRGTSVTLKGSGDLIYLALYEKNGCVCSIGSTAGFTVEQLENMIP